MKKTTIATVKSFIRKNKDFLFVNVKSSFDSQCDGVNEANGGFKKASPSERQVQYTLGVKGVWFIGSNLCVPYEDNHYHGYRVDNCCGAFIVAIPKTV